MATLGSDRFVGLCISWSSVALLYFDYALTFGMETRLIWGKGFKRFTTFLYFCCRYALVANVIYIFTITDHINTGNCHTGYWIADILGVFGRFGTVTIWGLRTYAVFGGSILIGLFFGGLGLTLVVLDIIDIPTNKCSGENVIPMKTVASHTSSENCAILTPKKVGHLRATIMVAFEASSALLTTLRAVQSLRAGGGSCRTSGRKSLIYLVLEQGILYFCLVTGITIASLGLNIASPGIFMEQLLRGYRGPMSGIMTARFILHLRKWEDDNASPCMNAQRSKDGLEFASQLDFGGGAQLASALTLEFGPDPVMVARQRRSVGDELEA